MADLYEVLIAAELRGDLPEAEIAELRWHLGLGPQPEELAIVTAWYPITVDEHGDQLPEDQWKYDMYPLLAERGPADGRVGGVAFSELARREDAGATSWALTSRQVLHPDELDLLGPLLQWLQEQATGYRGGPAYFSCHMRFFEDDLVLRPISVHGADIVLHEIKVVK
ncbi:hypothetical protein [Spirillospora sp. NPDC048824]|uniref:hypothetical protein n=1 Tax=Spirillospora sp. NPDC048824 TaxID=3364526 RepID=UPI0037113DF0